MMSNIMSEYDKYFFSFKVKALNKFECGDKLMLFSFDEISWMICIPRTTISKFLRRNNKIPYILGGNSRYYRKASILMMLDEMEKESIGNK
jgi:hypothetical protein